MNFFKKKQQNYIDPIAAQIGNTVTDKCPKCRQPLLRNAVGSEWCSSTECNYFIHHGRNVTPREITEMNLRYAGSKP